MKAKHLQPVEVKQSQFEDFLNVYKVDPEDRLAISESGSGSYIHFALKSRKQIEVYTLVEYFELCNRLRKVVSELKNFAKDIEELERLQTFIRLKVKGKPSIGKLFDFFEKSKESLGIQQYTVKQASVEQIFNKFAELGELTENNG